jgi:hypothetical protein
VRWIELESDLDELDCLLDYATMRLDMLESEINKLIKEWQKFIDAIGYKKT